MRGDYSGGRAAASRAHSYGASLRASVCWLPQNNCRSAELRRAGPVRRRLDVDRRRREGRGQPAQRAGEV